MENTLRQYWSKIRQAILSRWGSRVDPDDLEEPMDFDQLCEYFGERCELSKAQAQREAERILNELQARRPGL